MRHRGVLVPLLVTVGFALVACAGEGNPSTQPTATLQSPAVGNAGCDTTLCCPDCELVEVIEVQDGELIETPGGTLRMYGAYVNRPGEACATEAGRRMIELAGSQVRVEPVHEIETDSRGRRVAYLFTASGNSIDEIMIRDGLARAWTQDGQHSGWFVYRQSIAASSDDGCIWNLGPLGR